MVRSETMRTLITGGTVVTASDTFVADVLVDNGRIAGLAASFEGTFDETIDAKGQYVFPGGIDAHTHMFNTPVPNMSR